jgi:hypothetical protein
MPLVCQAVQIHFISLHCLQSDSTLDGAVRINTLCIDRHINFITTEKGGKKMKKAVIITVVLLCLLTGGKVYAQCLETIFTDVNTNTVSEMFCEYIERFSTLGITTGYPDGTYRPSQNVTRAQMATFIMRTIDNVLTAGSCPEGSSIRQILEDGSVICEVDTDTTYTAGSGLTFHGTEIRVSTPLSLSDSSAGGILVGQNSSTATAASGVRGISTASTGNTLGVFGGSSSISGTGVLGYATATSGTTYGVYGVSLSTEGSGLYGRASATSGNVYGVHGESHSTSGMGVYGHALATSGSAFGVLGESDSDSGRGVVGRAYAETGTTYGVYGTSLSSGGEGVHGWASATSGTTYGVSGHSSSVSGIGVHGLSSAGSGINYGVVGESSSTSGRGVRGYASATSGETYGVYGRSVSTEGEGVHGWASALSGHTVGVYGYSSSGSGRGVVGVGDNIGVGGYSGSTYGVGVYGNASATSGTTYGVAGDAVSSPDGIGVQGQGNAVGVLGNSPNSSGRGVYGSAPITGYAGYFQGRVYVAEALIKAGGGFKIDHPLDPENRYLYHSFVESPDMKNIYDGIALLDSNGEAWVELPEWFEALNKEFRYQLTCIGGFAPVYISERISGNRFKIAGGKEGMEISWMVTGIRKDTFAEANRIPVEEIKKPEELGYYLHPNAYGKTDEMSIEWARDPEGMKQMKEARVNANRTQ